MRAPFDNTCDIYGGADGPSPGVKLATCPCRVVPADAILLSGSEDPSYFGYVTLEAYQPRGGFAKQQVGTQETWDPQLSDQISVPAIINTDTYRVLFTEKVIWQGQAYFRSHVSKNLTNWPGSINSVQCSPVQLTIGSQRGVASLCTLQNYFFRLDIPAGTYHVTFTGLSFPRGEVRQGPTYGGGTTLTTLPFPGTYPFTCSGIQPVWIQIFSSSILACGPVTCVVT